MKDNFSGNERRIHKVYVTRNTEYHVRSEVCVAVRDRKSGRWIEGHLAVSKRMEGSLRINQNGMFPNPEAPGPGDAIYFRAGERDLITSRLETIDRPEKRVVEQYPR